MIFEGLELLKEYVEELRREFDLYLYRKIKSSEDSDIIERAVAGGKRLRPILLLMVFKALNGKDLQRALDVAIALELAHNASLAHDDIIDVDYMRRGKPTLWRQIGIGRALIEGHRIINLAFRIALNEGIEIARIFLNTWDRTSNGVLLELMNRDLPGKILYMEIIRKKTAALFEAAAECGAVIADAPSQVIQDIKRYGEKLGIVYQLADDYVDLIRGRFTLGSPILLYNKLEEKIRQIILFIKLGKIPPLKRVLSSRINWNKDFLIGEIFKHIKESQEIIDSMDFAEPHKTYLKKFPEYCVYSMINQTT